MKKIILFVDDEQSILNAIKRLFRKSPYNVLTAGNAKDALDVIRTVPISVLVSDYTMPGETGAELLAMAKSIRPEMNRIILSGNNDQEALLQSINLGSADRFLTKPWDDSELINEVDKAMAAWEEKRYTWPDKKLLNQTSFIQMVDELISEPETTNRVVIYFGVRDFENVQQLVGIEKIRNYLYEISPTPDSVEPSVTMAILDDNNFCGIIKLENEVVSLNQKISELIEPFLEASAFDNQKYSISLDVGYCVASPETVSALDLISNALTAYQHAKSSESGNYVNYQSWMSDKKHNDRIIESNLQHALKDSEFVLHYQPKINISNNTMHGAEALLRWNSKTLGMVSPFDFIHLAERSEAINDIGHWVMNEAVRQWLEWFGQSEVQPIVSVNVSPRQLKDFSFVKRVESVLQEHRIDPSRLELEITESLMVEDIKSTIKILNDIKALGVALSIDDFGTGYSSLSYLNQLPVDTLKIDRSFIFPMMESEEKRHLVNNLIKLGHDLGIDIVAEGVEDEQQLEVLKEYGCDVIQGYFYSPPVPSGDYSHLIEKFPPQVTDAQDYQQIGMLKSA